MRLFNEHAEVPVTKNSESEGPIPSVWRLTLKNIVDAFFLASCLDQRKRRPDLGLKDRCRMDAQHSSMFPGWRIGFWQRHAWR
jgi:hypothetical protein